MKILITSGGTKIPIDSVRSISNMSRGTFGSKIATEFLNQGHNVVFVKAKGSVTPMIFHLNLYDDIAKSDPLTYVPKLGKAMKFLIDNLENYSEHEYDTFDEYAELLESSIKTEKPDIILLAAAVSDYGVENFVDGKVRSNDAFNIRLKQLPKLISKVREWSKPETILVGFKLLVGSTPNELLDAARSSFKSNNLNMVVANDLNDIRNNNHKIHIVLKNASTVYTTDKSDPNYLAKMVVNNSLEL